MNTATPVVMGDTVYMAQWSDWVCALDLATGELNWRDCVPISIEGLHLYRDKLYVRSARQVAEYEVEFSPSNRSASKKFGTLPWAKLFAPAIQHAQNGFLVNPKIIEAAKRRATKYPEGRKIWARKVRMLQRGQPLVQTEAANVLKAVAVDGRLESGTHGVGINNV